MLQGTPVGRAANSRGGCRTATRARSGLLCKLRAAESATKMMHEKRRGGFEEQGESEEEAGGGTSARNKRGSRGTRDAGRPF